MGLTAKTAKDAYFLSRFEKSILPLMFLVVAIAIAPILSGYTKLAKKLAPKLMFILTTSIFCFSFIVSQSLIDGWVIPAVYVWVEIVVAIALIQFWGSAAESFQPQQAKRLFGIIAGGGSFAVMLIGMNLRPFVNAFGTDELLYLSSGFMIIAFLFGLLRPLGSYLWCRVPVLQVEAPEFLSLALRSSNRPQATFVNLQ